MSATITSMGAILFETQPTNGLTLLFNVPPTDGVTYTGIAARATILISRIALWNGYCTTGHP